MQETVDSRNWITIAYTLTPKAEPHKRPYPKFGSAAGADWNVGRFWWASRWF